MAVFSRRTATSALLLLLFISVAIRYPLVEHERYQTDSYYIHMLAGSIVKDGQATWLFHPLSYFGYYPYSYPSGFPVLLAEFSSMSGLSLESSILAINMVTAVLFCLGAFVLVRCFVRRPEYVILAVLLTVLGSRFVDTSYWDGGARAPMIVLFVLVIFSLFRMGSSQDKRYLIPASVIAVGCFAMHHMAVMLLLFGMAYVLTAFQTQFLLPRFGAQKRRVATVYGILILTTIVVVSFGFVDYFTALTLRTLRASSVFDIEPPFLSVILNIGISYTQQVGLVVPLAVLAIPVLYRRWRFSEEAQFPIWLLIVFVPLLGNSLYVSMVISPFISVLAIFWISDVVRRGRRHRSALLLVVMLVIVSLMLPVWSTQRWNAETVMSGDTVEVDNQVFNDAAYLMITYEDGLAISNVNTISLRLGAISGVGFLSSGIPLAINGDVTDVDVRNNVTWSSAPFPTNLYKWFDSNEEPTVDLYVRGLFVHGIGYLQKHGSYVGASEYFSKHSRMVVVVDNNWEDGYVTVHAIDGAIFPSELRMSYSSQTSTTFTSYVYYESERVSYYLVQLPL